MHFVVTVLTMDRIQRKEYFNWFQLPSTLINRTLESDACGYCGFGIK
jgi:hypothetical protein